MITSFSDDATESIWNGNLTKKLPNQIQAVARRKLRMLNNARNLNDLRIPPNNRLEALSGDRDGQHSIRINDQWRICFVWLDGQADRVEICDYHREDPMHKLANIHPGEVLKEEFLVPLEISQYKLAKTIGVQPIRISEICAGKRAITADTALRFARALGTSPGFWLGLQADYDTEEIERVNGAVLSQIQPIAA